ncbi:MAG: hypothetical protein LBQ95_02015 [Lachnospiraceae bacterium]|jgi:hypothetical protein|nr:hypothetical protein [Lachnospiraceae bacterium]
MNGSMNEVTKEESKITKNNNSLLKSFFCFQNKKSLIKALVYSLLFCFFAIAVYAVCFIVMVEPLEKYISLFDIKFKNPWLMSLVENGIFFSAFECGIPAVTGAIVLGKFFYLFKEKRIMLFSCIWMLLLAGIVDIYTYFTTAPEWLDFMKSVMFWFTLTPVLCSLALSLAQYCVYFKGVASEAGKGAYNDCSKEEKAQS